MFDSPTRWTRNGRAVLQKGFLGMGNGHQRRPQTSVPGRTQPRRLFVVDRGLGIVSGRTHGPLDRGTLSSRQFTRCPATLVHEQGGSGIVVVVVAVAVFFSNGSHNNSNGQKVDRSPCTNAYHTEQQQQQSESHQLAFTQERLGTHARVGAGTTTTFEKFVQTEPVAGPPGSSHGRISIQRFVTSPPFAPRQSRCARRRKNLSSFSP